MKSTNIMDPKMTIDAAHDYASRLFDLELRGSSDTDGALFRIEQKCGISPNQLMHLRSRRAKSCDVGLFARLRMAYLDLCQSQLAKLQHEIAVEKATGDDALSDIEAEVDRLAATLKGAQSGAEAGPLPQRGREMSRLKEVGLAPSDYLPYDDELDGDECGNCGGEGFTYHCIDGCCVNAEDGCDLCASRCDWCNPPRKRAMPNPSDD